jgi:hypothetical protein
MALPARFAGRRLPGNMTLAGSCSAAISAACHVQAPEQSRLLQQDKNDGDFDYRSQSSWGATNEFQTIEPGDDEYGQLITPRYEEEGFALTNRASHGVTNAYEYLIQLAQRPLKWGVPGVMSTQDGHIASRDSIGHLSFDANNVGPAQRGDAYAGRQQQS